MPLYESIVEDAALEWFGELGYPFGHGSDMAQGERAESRATVARAATVQIERRFNP